MSEPLVDPVARIVSGLEALDGQLGPQVMRIGCGMATATIVERVRN